jgi:hypothetical protein
MRVRRPSPATVIAMLALLVALTSTAYAANVVPLAKRALVADNAKKLKLKTPAQIAAMPGPATSLDGKDADAIAATPGPASTIAATVTVKTQPVSIPTFETVDSTVTCDAGQKAIAGGFEVPDAEGGVFSFDTRPSSDGTAWKLRLGSSLGDDVTGRVYAICVK